MKPIIFVTTFSESGYLLYGRSWIDSFIQHTSTHPNINAILYVDQFIPNLPSNIKQLLFNQSIPEHAQWCLEFDRQYDAKNIYGKTMGKRFSYKSFVMMHAIKNNPDAYLVWLDGDCIFKSSALEEFPRDLLGETPIACQMEENKGANHIESGIVIFDTSHEDTTRFLNAFRNNYNISQILHMKAPYDGFIICKTLLENNIPFNNLNKGFGIDGIQSDPSSTFLHPLLKNRFQHNIGYTGKSNYESWNSLKNSDPYFRLVKSSAPKKTMEQIREIKQQLFAQKMKRG